MSEEPRGAGPSRAPFPPWLSKLGRALGWAVGVFALGYALLPTLPLVLWFMVTLFDALHHTPREPGLIVPPVHEGPVATAPVVELDAEVRDLEPPVDDVEAEVDGR